MLFNPGTADQVYSKKSVIIKDFIPEPFLPQGNSKRLLVLLNPTTHYHNQGKKLKLEQRLKCSQS